MKRGCGLTMLAVLLMSIAGCGSSAGSAGSGNTGSFLGRASNAVVFIQWTRTGDNVSGSLHEAIRKESGESGVESESRSFTGTINDHGLTLTLTEGLGATTALVGTVAAHGFTLTYPGTDHDLISITFTGAPLSAYNAAVAKLENRGTSTVAPGPYGEEPGSDTQTNSSHSGGSQVVVLRCPTEYGVSEPAPSVPAMVPVSSAAAAGGLIAYTNTQVYLLGPRNMSCAGEVAADGGSQVIVWPQGDNRPAEHSASDGLTLRVDPACAGCKAADACPFFTTLARELGFPCTSSIPAGESVSRPSPNLALFEDDPGVEGSGWPSGGSDPANGVVGIAGTSRENTVYRATCTLPSIQHSVCTTILNYVIGRYG